MNGDMRLTREHSFKRQHVPAAVIAVAFVFACDGPTEPRPVEYLRVDPAWVVGDAAAGVDPVTGQFSLAYPASPRLSRAFAESVSVAVARFYGIALGNAKEVLEQDRGAPIDFMALQKCWRAVHVSSPYVDPPPAAPGWVRRVVADQWAIALCALDNRAQLSVGVPDAPADIRIADGQLVLRQLGGGSDFTGVGVPIRYPLGLPLTPEAAVYAVFNSSGKRIDAIPIAFNQLHLGLGQFPLCASWRIRTEAPMHAVRESNGTNVDISEVYVRNYPGCYSDDIAFFIPTVAQPNGYWFGFTKDTTGMGNSQEQDSVFVTTRAPTEFERVSIVK